MLGIIGLDDLALECVIGVYPYERGIKQPLFIDIKVVVDFGNSVTSDLLEDTIDYNKLVRILREVASQEFKLLEAYAYSACQKIINDLPASWVWIRLKKPLAIPEAKYAIVELEQLMKKSQNHEMDPRYGRSHQARR